MIIETGEKDSRYTYGQLNADTRLAYYLDVIAFLCRLRKVRYEIQEELTIPECRNVIDDLMEWR